MKTIISRYKCDHIYTTIFAKSATKQEMEAMRVRNRESLCPKCELRYGDK